jgi:hypothetical protein
MISELRGTVFIYSRGQPETKLLGQNTVNPRSLMVESFPAVGGYPGGHSS